MQLFITSTDPNEAAAWLDDKRVNKIITESAQIICTVLHGELDDLPFKPTHEHHPIVKWAANTEAALYWTLRYHLALENEWRSRFNKAHASRLGPDVINHIHLTKPPKTFPNCAKNDAYNLDFTWCEDVPTAYRLYLTGRWINDTRPPVWTKRPTPPWYAEFPVERPELLKLYTQEIKQRIGKKTHGIMPCLRCGGDMKFHSAGDFHCMESKSCLLWRECA